MSKKVVPKVNMKKVKKAFEIACKGTDELTKEEIWLNRTLNEWEDATVNFLLKVADVYIKAKKWELMKRRKLTKKEEEMLKDIEAYKIEGFVPTWAREFALNEYERIKDGFFEVTKVTTTLPQFTLTLLKLREEAGENFDSIFGEATVYNYEEETILPKFTKKHININWNKVKKAFNKVNKLIMIPKTREVQELNEYEEVAFKFLIVLCDYLVSREIEKLRDKRRKSEEEKDWEDELYWYEIDGTIPQVIKKEAMRMLESIQNKFFERRAITKYAKYYKLYIAWLIKKLLHIKINDLLTAYLLGEVDYEACRGENV